MSAKVKMTVSVDAQVAERLTAASRRRGTSRSGLVAEALDLWERSILEQELREGYEAMAHEDREGAEQSIAALWEVVK